MKRPFLALILLLGLAVAAAVVVAGWRFDLRRRVEARPPGSKAVVDVQQLRLVYDPPPTQPLTKVTPLAGDVLVAGGGLGGVAAALGACEAGRTVILTEE